jgi:hypothetical protein
LTWAPGATVGAMVSGGAESARRAREAAEVVIGVE